MNAFPSLFRIRKPSGPPVATGPSPAANIGEVRDLIGAGYRVEDLGIEFGASFAGKFRWVNVRNGEAQDDTLPYSRSEDDAWALAKADHQKVRIA